MNNSQLLGKFAYYLILRISGTALQGPWIRSTGPGWAIGQGPLVQVSIVDKVHWYRLDYWSTGPGRDIGQVHWSRSGYWTRSTGPGRDSGQGPLVQVGIVDNWTRSTGPGRDIGQGPLVQVGIGQGPLVQVWILDKVHWSR